MRYLLLLACCLLGSADMLAADYNILSYGAKNDTTVLSTAAVQQAIEEQQSKSQDNMDYIDYDIVRKDGAIRHVADVGYKVFNGTEYVYYVYIADVTELDMD